MTTSGLSFLTFNIGNPSEQRAERQLAWLAGRPEHVLVLTETKASVGCRLLASAFTEAGWHVSFPVPAPGEYGVMIISRVQARPGDFGDRIGYLPTRAASVTLPAPAGPIEVIGAYVPSRDAGLEKTERKRKWVAACLAALAARDTAHPAVLLGDLNVLEPSHQPRYPFFVPFEYDFYRALGADHGLLDAFRHLHPGSRRVQLGRPDWRRVPLRSCVLLRQPRPCHQQLRIPARTSHRRTLRPLSADGLPHVATAARAGSLRPGYRSCAGHTLLAQLPAGGPEAARA